jgi:hypothetical protein
MQCFEFNECLLDGIRIDRFPSAHVPSEGPQGLSLDPKLRAFINRIPRSIRDKQVALMKAIVVHRARSVMLAPQPRGQSDNKALVWVTTATRNGTIGISTGPKQGSSIITGASFRVNAELTQLELLVELQDGGSFLIRRTGALDDAPAVILVQWKGGNITAFVPHPKAEFRESQWPPTVAA